MYRVALVNLQLPASLLDGTQLKSICATKNTVLKHGISLMMSELGANWIASVRKQELAR